MVIFNNFKNRSFTLSNYKKWFLDDNNVYKQFSSKLINLYRGKWGT